MDRGSVPWYGNICAVVTPFNRDGSLDVAAFRENIGLLMQEGIHGIIVAGDTGEFWALSDDERYLLFELARDVAQDAIAVLGNASAMSTEASIRHARAAKERGLDGVMMTPPFYVRPGEREIWEHYRAVSDAVAIPIMLYNLPARQGVNLSVSLIERLCDIDNVVAIKQSAASFQDVVETIRLCKGKIRVFAGHSCDRGFPAVLMGADGYVSSVEPQAMGREAIQMYELAVAGEIEAGRRVQMRCIELDHAVHGFAGTFPASLKAAMNLVGRPGGYPRRPLLYPTDEEIERLRATLSRLGLLGVRA